jgi:hypothetical protein
MTGWPGAGAQAASQWSPAPGVPVQVMHSSQGRGAVRRSFVTCHARQAVDQSVRSASDDACTIRGYMRDENSKQPSLVRHIPDVCDSDLAM